jgi:DtxR family Mn-dependent transcriptional regulator
MQMYLVTIARLRDNNRPVPLPLLADTLAISPSSANEMCRKLQDQGLVVYLPYKGVWLTDEGEEHACHIMRRHRLWEVFAVDKLGFDYDEAHDVACQLEHASSNYLADRLDLFLDYPPVNPLGKLIPRGSVQLPDRPTVVLADLPAGQRGRVTRCDLESASRSFLAEQGIRPGVWLKAIATAEDSVLVRVGRKHVSLAQDLAEVVQVEVSLPSGEPSDGPLNQDPTENRSKPIELEKSSPIEETSLE